MSSLLASASVQGGVGVVWHYCTAAQGIAVRPHLWTASQTDSCRKATAGSGRNTQLARHQPQGASMACEKSLTHFEHLTRSSRRKRLSLDKAYDFLAVDLVVVVSVSRKGLRFLVFGQQQFIFLVGPAPAVHDNACDDRGGSSDSQFGGVACPKPQEDPGVLTPAILIRADDSDRGWKCCE